MNTIITINWTFRYATVSFIDIEDMAYTIDLGYVTTYKGARHRVRRELFDKYGIRLSRMRFKYATREMCCFCANRVED